MQTFKMWSLHTKKENLQLASGRIVKGTRHYWLLLKTTVAIKTW